MKEPEGTADAPSIKGTLKVHMIREVIFWLHCSSVLNCKEVIFDFWFLRGKNMNFGAHFLMKTKRRYLINIFFLANLVVINDFRLFTPPPPLQAISKNKVL